MRDLLKSEESSGVVEYGKPRGEKKWEGKRSMTRITDLYTKGHPKSSLTIGLRGILRLGISSDGFQLVRRNLHCSFRFSVGGLVERLRSLSPLVALFGLLSRRLLACQ